jgi:hypothetical protein
LGRAPPANSGDPRFRPARLPASSCLFVSLYQTESRLARRSARRSAGRRQHRAGSRKAGLHRFPGSFLGTTHAPIHGQGRVTSAGPHGGYAPPSPRFLPAKKKSPALGRAKVLREENQAVARWPDAEPTIGRRGFCGCGTRRTSRPFWRQREKARTRRASWCRGDWSGCRGFAVEFAQVVVQFFCRVPQGLNQQAYRAVHVRLVRQFIRKHLTCHGSA